MSATLPLCHNRIGIYIRHADGVLWNVHYTNRCFFAECQQHFLFAITCVGIYIRHADGVIWNVHHNNRCFFAECQRHLLFVITCVGIYIRHADSVLWNVHHTNRCFFVQCQQHFLFAITYVKIYIRHTDGVIWFIVYKICITLAIAFMLSVSDTSSLPLPVLGHTYATQMVYYAS